MTAAGVVTAVALLTFVGALVASFFYHDDALINLTVGAAIANATSAVQYWLGSSIGSAKKDETISQNQKSGP